MISSYWSKGASVVLVVLLLTGCGQDVSDSERKQKAQEMSSKHQYRSAIIELKNVLQNAPSDSEARLALATIYIITGQADSAEKEIRKVSGADQKSEQAVMLLAEALVMQKEYQSFIERIEINNTFSKEGKEKLHLQRAKVNAALGRLDQAESEYKAILSENPKVAGALTGLAMIYFAHEKFDEGLANIEQAIEVDADFADAWRLKGAVYSKRGNYQESEQVLRRAIELYKKSFRFQEEYLTRVGLVQTLLIMKKSEQFVAEIKELKRLSAEHPLTLYFTALNDFLNKNYADAESGLSLLIGRMPNHLPSLLLLGSVHFAEGNYEQANTYLTQFINSVPTHIQARKILGATRLKLQRPEDALEILTPIAGSDVDDAEILAMVGRAASQSDQREMALSFYARASKAAPENYQLREELAKSYLQSGEFDNAIATLEQTTGDDELNAKLLIAYAYLKEKNIEKAKQILGDLIPKYQKDERLQLVQATVDLLEGKRAEARVKLETLERNNQKSVPAIYALAKIDLEDGKLKKSRERFSRILEWDEKNIQVMISLAQLEEQVGASEKSIMWLEQARTIDASAQLPRLILSRYFYKTKRFDKSLEVVEELLSIDSTSGVTLVQHGAVLLAMNRPEKAAEAYEKIVEYYPRDARGYLALSKIYSRLGDKTRAAGVLKKMEASTKDKIVVALARIELELQSKNPDKAIKLAVKLLAKHPKNFAANMLLANGKIATKDIDGAIATLRNAIKFSDRREPIIQLAQLQLRQNSKKNAVAELERWLKRRDNSDVRFLLASVYQMMGRLGDAGSQYKKLLAIDKGNPLILNNLTLIYLETDIDLAVDTAELAMKRAGDRPEILDTYGWVLVQAGQTERGIDSLRKALGLTDNSEIRYHLAYALENIGKYEEAHELVNTLQKDAALNSELKKLVMKLQKKLPR
ncbi:MAG: PEP-CTERM system TPR-repeat protein PrsT [Candidatus Polarisedimenticolaceae bacterium]|nr:PEP-CTERM system TPR-repeat protein PrsT [Candidatus Polarisedimenticolaceae bacterium]